LTKRIEYLEETTPTGLRLFVALRDDVAERLLRTTEKAHTTLLQLDPQCPECQDDLQALLRLVRQLEQQQDQVHTDEPVEQ
jgi:hypothetical protein